MGFNLPTAAIFFRPPSRHSLVAVVARLQPSFVLKSTSLLLCATVSSPSQNPICIEDFLCFKDLLLAVAYSC
jgi:hypothetical protein